MKPKGRPKKLRNVYQAPKVSLFSPRGKPGRPDEVSVGIEELEAIKLADHLGLEHAEAAKHMEVSRQSFGRVLQKAHKTIADALVNGKIIRIEGGSYRLKTIDSKKAINTSKNQ